MFVNVRGFAKEYISVAVVLLFVIASDLMSETIGQFVNAGWPEATIFDEKFGVLF